MASMSASSAQSYENDDFAQYINTPQEPWTEWHHGSLFQWWNACCFPGLRQMAFDALSVPAMSAELERVFSQAKRFYTDDRNRLSTDSFEALQCLKQWSQQKVYDITVPERINDTPANGRASFA